MNPKTVIFYGTSGSGKGTQAKLLASFLELQAPNPMRCVYIETGALLRGFIETTGHTQTKTKEVMDSGGLLPAFLPAYIWSSTLIEQFTGTEHLILDGLARRPSEAPILDEALLFYGRENFDVVVFDLTDESATNRLLSRGRGDDMTDHEAIKRKLAWYKENTEPAIRYFESQGRAVHHIDAEPSIEAIHQEVRKVLNLA
jgi:adenylate kinase